MHFRFYCLNEEDRIVIGDHLMAPDLDSAIRAAYEACRDHPHFPTSRIEIWRGATRLYASGYACDGASA